MRFARSYDDSWMILRSYTFTGLFFERSFCDLFVDFWRRLTARGMIALVDPCACGGLCLPTDREPDWIEPTTWFSRGPPLIVVLLVPEALAPKPIVVYLFLRICVLLGCSASLSERYLFSGAS